MLPSYIKPKGFVWNVLPFHKNFANTVFQTIYLPKHVYNNLQSSKPTIQYQALLLHEQEHRKRLHKSPIRWCVKYLCSATFRFEEELIAYKVQQKFLRKHHEELPIEKIARYLSSGTYLWCTSFEKAKEKLTE